MAVNIHPSSIVSPNAQIGEGTTIGPFCVIGDNVIIGKNNRIDSHGVIDGHTTIGDNNHFFAYCAIGGVPQSVTYSGEPTLTVIGDRNIFRENVTVSRGTTDDEGITSIADDNFIMAYCHIAHDCRLSSSLIFANSVCLAGHVHVEDFVVMSGYTLVHQFCRIGTHAFVGPCTAATQDIPPYTMTSGNKAITHGINFRGLKRRDIPSEAITELKRCYKIIYRSGFQLKVALAEIEQREFSSSEVKHLVEFFRKSERGVIR